MKIKEQLQFLLNTEDLMNNFIYLNVWNEVTHSSLSVVFFTEFAIIVVVKGWIAFYTLLLTQLMVLAFGAIHSSIHNLKSGERKKKVWLIPIQTLSAA